MTDIPVPAAYTPTRLQRTVGRVIAFARANLAPNRISIYLTVVADVGALLLVLFSDLGLPQVAAVGATVLAINAKLLKFLSGWQQYESALLQRDLIAYRNAADADATERAIQAQNAVSKPNRSQPAIAVPGRGPR